MRGGNEKNLRKKPAKVGGGTKKTMEGGTKKTLEARLPTAPLGAEIIQKQNMNWFDTALIVVIYFSYTNGSHEGFV